MQKWLDDIDIEVLHYELIHSTVSLALPYNDDPNSLLKILSTHLVCLKRHNADTPERLTYLIIRFLSWISSQMY